MKNRNILGLNNDVILRVKPEGSNVLKRFFALLRMTRVGFTLAEVLITLAIIGVVAVLTVPNLIQDIQERDWNTGDKVFIKRLEQSLKIMNTQSVLSGYKTTEDFVEELQKHFKIANVCPSDRIKDCFGEEFYTSKKKLLETSLYKTSGNFAIADWGTNVVGVQFGNGVSGLLAYNPNCEENPSSNEVAVLDCIALLYDVNGFSKPNQITKDIRRTANVGENFADPIVINGVKITKVVKAGEYPPVIYDNGTWPSCEDFKAQYGTQYCTSGNDYYAGAVATCGGKNNVATQKDLAAIAQYLYDYPSISDNYDGNKNLTKNTELVSYGFPENDFWAWDSSEYSDRYSFKRFFLSNNTYRGTCDTKGYTRGTSGGGVVCVAH